MGPRQALTSVSRFVAFLRAINVGGHVVTMAELRRLFGTLGLRDVETFIASGNVIFASPAGNTTALEERIEARLEKSLGYPVATFIRTETEVTAIARCAPFPAEMIASAPTFCVGFLAEALSPAATRALLALRTGFDEFHLNDREVYWLSKRKQSESTISNGALERAVGAQVTFRGMKTVSRLVAKYRLST